VSVIWIINKYDVEKSTDGRSM